MQLPPSPAAGLSRRHLRSLYPYRRNRLFDGTQTFQSVRPAEFYSADARLNNSGENPRWAHRPPACVPPPAAAPQSGPSRQRRTDLCVAGSAERRRRRLGSRRSQSKSSQSHSNSRRTRLPNWEGRLPSRPRRLTQTPLQFRAIQQLRNSIDFREGVVKVRTYP
jgi:hypothetical protein